jgi:hypothetical protein
MITRYGLQDGNGSVSTFKLSHVKAAVLQLIPRID